MKKTIILLVIILLLSSPITLADRGSIPFLAGVQIFEPSQDALVAWNGEEEILILSTELYASENTKVLQVLPLPAEPEVTKSSRDVLRRANEFLLQKELIDISQPGFRSSRSDIMPGGELKKELVIGSHDISVVEVKNQSAFINWVNNHLKEKGQDNPVIPEDLSSTINDYINRGYNYFVFDTIEVSPEAEFNEAISYKFKSDHLYYPLEITKSDHGISDIRLIIISDQNLINYSGLTADRVNILSSPKNLTQGELAYISSSLAELFFDDNINDSNEINELKIATWQIVDDLANFDNDLLVNSDLNALEENQISYRGKTYVDLKKDNSYPFESNNEVVEISGVVEEQMGSRMHPWIALSVDNKILFDIKNNSFLKNFDALGQNVIIKGHQDTGTLVMRDPIDKMGIMIEIENAFFVSEIIGWSYYTALPLNQNGEPASKRVGIWLEDTKTTE